MTTYRKFRDEFDCDDVEMCLACNTYMVCSILFDERTTSEIKNCPCYTCLVTMICEKDCDKRKDYSKKLSIQDELRRKNYDISIS